MQITSEQEKILNSFKCERLSENAENAELIKSFTNARGVSLVSYFKKLGKQEDEEGKTTYYVIKDCDNNVFMFFSLKCGALFDPLLDENEVKQDFQRLVVLLQAIENADGSHDSADKVSALLNKYQVGDRISAENLFFLIWRKASKKRDFLKSLFGDKEKEKNEKIFRVQNTHSGVELVHFCTNDSMKDEWRALGLNHPMGETLFWQFIAPKFFEVQKIAGCEYAFLFAADLSEDGSLVNYYDVSLKFQQRQDMGTNKPFYDFCCEFMCQTINQMKISRKEFFENFNGDADD